MNAGVSVGVFAGGVVALAIACNLQKGADAAVCTAPTAGNDACVLPLVAQDSAAHMAWTAAEADAVTRCGVDAPTVRAIWGAHVQAETIEGFVPRLNVGGSP